MSGGGSPSRVTQVNEPPAYLTDYITNTLMPLFGEAGSGSLNPIIPQGVPVQAPLHPWVDQGNMMNYGYINSPMMGQQLGQMFGGLNQAFGGFNPGQNGLYGATSPYSGLLGETLASILSNPGGAMGGPGQGGWGGSGSFGMQVNMGSPLEAPGDSDIQGLIDATSDDMTRAFERADLANIRASAINAGQLGGSRQGIAEGVAQEGLGRAILTMSSNVRHDSYERERDRQAQLAAASMQAQMSGAGASAQAMAQQQIAAGQQRLQALELMGGFMGQGSQQGFNATMGALGLAPNIMNYPLSLGQNIAQMGGAYTQYGQQGLDAWVQRYLQNGGVRAQDLQLLGGLVQGTSPGSFGTSNQTNRGAQQNPWVGAAGGAMTGAGIAASAGLLSNPYGWAIIGLGALAGAYG